RLTEREAARLNLMLGDAVGPADLDRFQVTVMHEAVDGSFRHPHDRGNLEDGQEPVACRGRSVAGHDASSRSGGNASMTYKGGAAGPSGTVLPCRLHDKYCCKLQ